MRPARVVAADALLRRAADVERFVEEVGVGARSRVDDRVAPVDELELLVAPARRLAALVLAVPDRDRLLGQRLARVSGFEDQLDHLPVALVQVVPVVVDVEQPVLERELAWVADRRRRARRRSARFPRRSGGPTARRCNPGRERCRESRGGTGRARRGQQRPGRSSRGRRGSTGREGRPSARQRECRRRPARTAPRPHSSSCSTSRTTGE